MAITIIGKREYRRQKCTVMRRNCNCGGEGVLAMHEMKRGFEKDTT
jgi:hypothetical protein